MILLEDGPAGQPARFDGARRVVAAHALDQIAPALAELDAARQQGLWVAGWMAYEAGFAFEPRLRGLTLPQGPLLQFGLFDAPQPFAAPESRPVRLSPPRPLMSRAAYDSAFARVQAYIAAGDCYQVNLTFPLEARLLQGDALALYAALSRQKVGHGGYLDLGGPVLVSRSPELFLKLDADGRIETRPMKGTAPRGQDPVEDAELAEGLRQSEKDRAENLMIVDLLRNDIARIARVGSVKVPALYHVETYPTVHQMISRVTGRLADKASLSGLMAALFPCGSITGAPKIRAMQIIHEVEVGPRAAYCGAMGWMAPDGSAAFNVAIRTLSVTGDKVSLAVGGGVTQGSTAAGEWEEALWKARYLQSLVTPA